jgi:GNAT superfamily N-acetyltransferase
MSASFSFVIRDGLERDIPGCLSLDAGYETDFVWQMSIQHESGQHRVTFKTERLPREMSVDYPSSERRLRMALPSDHCFLVAVGRDEPETLGYLTLRQDPTHGIAWVHDIVVARIYRRRKIGTRLLKIARQWAVEHQLVQVIVETQTKNYPGISFCQKAGLTFCGYNDQYFQNQDIAVFFGQSLR